MFTFVSLILDGVSSVNNSAMVLTSIGRFSQTFILESEFLPGK